ncbi:methyl-CpG binding domain-containing protein 7-like [Trifolium pratense]|uniref:Methyl-CpG binding domain-containing protein 7-like n=1 Tax=Trifolium pratense TaxID=57577 RepID=A0A2K3MNR6_TRIPR|nr:methyl-CpG binding domain-containing protein 7-like [Trifolium pratense]
MALITRAPNTEMNVENEPLNCIPLNSNSSHKQLQILLQSPPRSPFNLPDDWLVEHRPRFSNPNQVDKYYIEPQTGHKFRSLVAVQRYLNGETRNYLPIERMISENKDTIVLRSPQSPFKLPDDWVVEHRPRVSKPNCVDRVDRYYIEPHTGVKFRSLVSVQRYLNEETRDDLPTERMISENKNTTFIKSRTAQKCLSPSDFEARKFLYAKDFEGRLTGENACRETPKLVSKFGSGKRSAPSMNSYENPVEKSFSVAEDQATLKPSIQSTHSENFDSQKKIKTGEDDRGSIHNLTRPPTKVSWVLSGPGGFWNPFLDDSIIAASEKAEWSKAFSISINEGVTN